MERTEHMTNLYPLFAGGRILKKELLWALRDYSYEALSLKYSGCTDGILQGLKVTVEGNSLIVGTGMLKYRDFIYLLTEEVKVPYTHTGEFISLKGIIEEHREHPDYILYSLTFILDENLSCKENEIEICRFKLKEGAALRDTYIAFYDIQTEYDTINLAHVKWAGKGVHTLHPYILKTFARELSDGREKNMEDYAFCYQILSGNGIVNREVISCYLADRTGIPMKEVMKWDNEEVFYEMENILKHPGIRQMGHREGSRNRIVVD